jgi:hypothetical protein
MTQSDQLFPEEDDESGDVKGTISSVVRRPRVSNNVRRHRLISISYTSLIPCHGRGRGFESRRPRHSHSNRAYAIAQECHPATGSLCLSRSNSSSRPTHWEYFRLRIFSQDALASRDRIFALQLHLRDRAGTQAPTAPHPCPQGDHSTAAVHRSLGAGHATVYDPAVSLLTQQRIKRFAAQEPVILLPAHDPDAPSRLVGNEVLR